MRYHYIQFWFFGSLKFTKQMGVIIVRVSLQMCLGENTYPYTSTDRTLVVNVKEVQRRESTDVTDF
jgi:hypothetical protein